MRWVWFLVENDFPIRSVRLVEKATGEAPDGCRMHSGPQRVSCWAEENCSGRVVMRLEDLRRWQLLDRDSYEMLLHGWTVRQDWDLLPEQARSLVEEQVRELDLRNGFRLSCLAASSSYGQPVLVLPDGTESGLDEIIQIDGRFLPAWEAAVEQMPFSEAASRIRMARLANPSVPAGEVFRREIFS